MLCLIGCAPCLAAQVEIAVAGSSGTPLKDALVIVQDLQAHGKDERELFRGLTDERGNITPHTLPPRDFIAPSPCFPTAIGKPRSASF